MKASTEQAERLHRFAHDLRNRLIGLQQVLEQLKDGPASPDRDELVVFGEQQFFKALREVEMMMDDLGVERGSVTPEPVPVDSAELLRTRIDLMQHRFQRKEQRVELDLEEALVVLVDPRLIDDVVDALLSNASKFSDHGAPIKIRSFVDGADAVIEVVDAGTGLSPADLEQVFVRFAWLSNKPTGGESQGRGTLARMRERVAAHAGTLTAHSNGAGKGSTFTIRLAHA